MNKRDLKLDKFGISKKRYKELCGFCEQYPEWKASLDEYAFVKGVSYSQSPRSQTNNISSPVEDAVIRNERYLANVQLIERVAKKADPDYYQFIIDSVCYEVPLKYLINVKGMNMSEFPFYTRRRYFFFLLDQEKK